MPADDPHSADEEPSRERASARVLFVHVMKTGGTSLLAAARRNVEPSRFLPRPTGDIVESSRRYLSIDELSGQSRDVLDQIDFFAGHLPYASREIVGAEVSTMAVLREPVGRTVSYLQQCAAMNPEHRGWPLEAIYEDEWFNVRFIRNHQTKVFSMTLAESLAPPVPERPYEPTELEARVLLELSNGPLVHPITVDEHRYAVAVANLQHVDLLGVHEHYDRLQAMVEDRMHWEIDRRIRARASAPVTIPASFGRRILEDNDFDVALHRRAVELVHSRSSAG